MFEIVRIIHRNMSQVLMSKFQEQAIVSVQFLDKQVYESERTEAGEKIGKGCQKVIVSKNS